MADATNIATNATVLTALTGLVGGAIAGYFGYRAKVQERQVDGSSAIEVKRLENEASTETHLWAYVEDRNKQIAALTADLANKTTLLARAEARIIVLQGALRGATKTDSGKKRVLLVDDYSDVLDMVIIMLRDEPYELQTAGNGQIALDLYEQAQAIGHPFDVVVLDIRMPLMDGIDVARTIRGQGDNKTKLLWFTANPDKAVERDQDNKIVRNYTEEFNVIGIITKPCDATDVQNAIRKALDLS